MKVQDIPIVTLTNAGYVPYTLNCLSSLRTLGFASNVVCYCVGSSTHRRITRAGYKAILLGSGGDERMLEFHKEDWAEMMLNKLYAIHQQLQSNPAVIYTDGDIYFRDRRFMDHCLEAMEKYELVGHRNGMSDSVPKSLCAGFMVIKATEKMLHLLDPAVVRSASNIEEGWGDQIYINQIRESCDYLYLPLALFPNGRYFRRHAKTLSPYMIHFNYNKKREKAWDLLKYGAVASWADRGRMIMELAYWWSERIHASASYRFKVKKKIAK